MLKCGSCGSAAPENDECLPCRHCADVLEIVPPMPSGDLRAQFALRRSSPDPRSSSGVWRFAELLPQFDLQEIVSLGEGNTPELDAPQASAWSGVSRLQIKHLGMNPTGSYKDAGMTVAVTRARSADASVLACASTGNTSASLAVYAARAGLRAMVLLPAAHVTQAKLAQALDAGAEVYAVHGDFDAAMARAQSLAAKRLVYLVNSVNPYRREGQKTVAFEILERRGWHPPQWVVVPGGNLGHCVSLASGFAQAHALGLSEGVPRIVVAQASGAAPFVRAWQERRELQPVQARTFASAIQIGNPVSWRPALRALDRTGGLAVAVSDDRIAEARAVLARDGLACEPASAASLAGCAELRERGVIGPDDDVVAVLTGNSLKDTAHIISYHESQENRYANRIREIGDDAQLEASLLEVPA